MNTNRTLGKPVIGLLQRIISVVLLVVIASTHAMVPTAHAGLWDWVSGRVAKAQTPEREPMSERQLTDYLIASGQPGDAPEDDHAVIVGSAILPHSSVAYEPAPGTYRYRMTLEVSAYNSEVAQTDDSPFITAKGTHVRDGIVATNILPFGTRVKIPSMFGDKVFVVEDRMNSRYQNHMDIWMENKQDALKFGRRTLEVEVIR